MNSVVERLQILSMLYEVQQRSASSAQPEQRQLQHLEHLLILSMEILSSGASLSELPFRFRDQFMLFCTSVNSRAMEVFTAGRVDEALATLLRAVDILLHKNLHKFVKPVTFYGHMKVLTFNNLAVIYQRKSSLSLALKSVEIALQIEEILVINDPLSISIVSTLSNKAAILSSLKKHSKAQQEIHRALSFISAWEDSHSEKQQQDKQQSNPIQQQSEQKQQQEQESTSEQPGEKQSNSNNNNNNQVGNDKEPSREEVLHLKMMCLYNLAAEDEHLLRSDRARANYLRAKQVADSISHPEMQNRIDTILKALK